jgi:hypothetical protein
MSRKELLTANKVPDIQHSKPEVFIIESLTKNDEDAKRFEGMVLSDMLRLTGKNPKYYYFQSKDELPHLIGLFRQSQYRYLHISSHASSTDIGITEGAVTYSEFSNIFKDQLKLRRLFFSACQVGNENFVNTLSAQNKGMHSIVAPAQNIEFSHAAAIWSSLYISLFAENDNSMKHSDIKKRLMALRSLFPVDFYYATYISKKDKWNHEVIS